MKPAWEPVIVARKPLIGTVAANVAAFGTGGLNVDGCRIEAAGGSPAAARRAAGMPTPRTAAESNEAGRWRTVQDAARYEAPRAGEARGRWPANVMLDEEAAAALDAQTGTLKARSNKGPSTATSSIRVALGRMAGSACGDEFNYDEGGGASRFFYVAKASRSEREAGLHEAGLHEAVTTDGRKKPIDNPYLRGETLRKNTHATVKPVAVMAWLCRLVTPANGIVLDPFTGSGTTGVAAIREGFNFIGIEREAQYVEIARARIAATGPQSSDQLALL